MTIAEGNTVYVHRTPPCSGVGLQWTEQELDAALKAEVAAVLFDDEGMADVESILVDLAETDFAQEGLRRILKSPTYIEDWRVGEALAETYLACHRACYFPWPDGRDERKFGSSLPGADLVGFGTDEEGDCLAFGEVKTSSEARFPPNVMYGPMGLKQQLEDLRDQEALRDGLLKYLGHRAGEAAWRSRFEAASRRYLQNKSDIQLYGVLIRDVPPNKDDLRARVQHLAQDCPDETVIELLALYLPKGCIHGIGRAVVAKRTGGAA